MTHRALINTAKGFVHRYPLNENDDLISNFPAAWFPINSMKLWNSLVKEAKPRPLLLGEQRFISRLLSSPTDFILPGCTAGSILMCRSPLSMNPHGWRKNAHFIQPMTLIRMPLHFVFLRSSEQAQQKSRVEPGFLEDTKEILALEKLALSVAVNNGKQPNHLHRHTRVSCLNSHCLSSNKLQPKHRTRVGW